jgi:hypothetical protein
MLDNDHRHSSESHTRSTQQRRPHKIHPATAAAQDPPMEENRTRPTKATTTPAPRAPPARPRAPRARHARLAHPLHAPRTPCTPRPPRAPHTRHGRLAHLYLAHSRILGPRVRQGHLVYSLLPWPPPTSKIYNRQRMLDKDHRHGSESRPRSTQQRRPHKIRPTSIRPTRTTAQDPTRGDDCARSTRRRGAAQRPSKTVDGRRGRPSRAAGAALEGCRRPAVEGCRGAAVEGCRGRPRGLSAAGRRGVPGGGRRGVPGAAVGRVGR